MPSPNPIARTKSVGAKVTEEEYAGLEKLAAARNLTLGEWCREVLLARLNPVPPSPVEEILLAEILGTRMIVLNMVYAVANGEKLSGEEMKAMIRQVDQEKVASAVERLTQGRTAEEPQGDDR